MASECDDDPILVRAVRRWPGPVRGRLAGRGGGGIRRRIGWPCGPGQPATGAVLIAVCCLSLVCWSRAWRQRMRADGVLADRFPLVSTAGGAAEPAGAQPGRPARGQARGAVGPRRQARRPPIGPARERRRAERGRRPGRGRSASAGGRAVQRGGLVRPWRERSGRERSARTGPRECAGCYRGSAPTERCARRRLRSIARDNGSGADPGERAAELISELRSMLEPLLAATGGQPALAGTQAAPLPRRTRGSRRTLRPRDRRRRRARRCRRAARAAPMSIPRLAPAADDGVPGPASDGEDMWW